MSTVAPIFKRPRLNNSNTNSHSKDVPDTETSLSQNPDPLQPIHNSILNRPSRQASPATFIPVQIELSHFRPVAFRIFTKKHNLTLKSDALAILAEHIGRKCGSEWRVLGEPVLDEIARAWARAEGAPYNTRTKVDSNPLVEGELLIPVLKALEVPHVARSTSFMLQSSQPNPSMYESQSGDSTPATQFSSVIEPIQFFSVIDAFSQPKYIYNSGTKTFQLGPKPSIIAAPKEKAMIFKERYHVILQRLLRNDLFQSHPAHMATKHQTAGKISSINNLLGRRNQHFLLFGLLTRSPSGVLSLSDPDGSVALDITDAVSAGGIFAPGVFVLVDGKYTDRDIFRVHTMVMPPSERREVSKQVFGHVDFLGAREAGLKGSLVPVEREYERFLVKAERAAGSVRMIFLGEVNLDQPRILKALKAMFEYYSGQEEYDLPLTFVLMGSFISTPFPSNGYSTTYKSHWDALADILSHYPKLTNECSFVFIPGPNDPWTTLPTCHPRKGIPDLFTNRVRRLCKNVKFVSNPCRLGYFTQDLCVFRYQIADALIRNRIVIPSPQQDPTLDEATQAARDLVKTILDQSHLTPFPLQQSPTYWSYDHTLRIYPLPTTLILSDTSGWGPFRVTYEGCNVINVGSLLKIEAEGMRGRYAASWWEWDCGVREGREVSVALTDREESGGLVRLEKKERKRKGVRMEGSERMDRGDGRGGEGEGNGRQIEDLRVGEMEIDMTIEEIQVDQTQEVEREERREEESQFDTQMEEDDS